MATVEMTSWLFLLGNNFPWISCISHILWAERGSDKLFFQSLFQGDLYNDQTWKILWLLKRKAGMSTVQYNKDNVPSRAKKLGRFAWTHYKKFRYPKFGVPQLWCKPTVCSSTHLSHSASLPWDLRGMGNWQEQETRAACTVSVNLFGSDPRVSCLLPGSMKCWQSNSCLEAEWNLRLFAVFDNVLTILEPSPLPNVLRSNVSMHAGPVKYREHS